MTHCDDRRFRKAMAAVTVSVLSKVRCVLGEGLYWDSRGSVLWMVDILGQELLRFDPVTGRMDRRGIAEPIGWVLGISDCESMLVGLASGMAAVKTADFGGPVAWIDRSFPGLPDMRLNDAAVDKFGRVWAGSMSRMIDVDSPGSFARFSFDGAGWETIDVGYSVPNGPAFNADCSVMLHSDSTERTVFRYELDTASGEVLDRSIWCRFPVHLGLPDGMTFDQEGFVWIAHWGVGLVRRYDPSARMDIEIRMPTPHVTNVSFGGPNLDRLFVSSARHGLASPDALAGALFEIEEHGLKGIPQWEAPPMTTWVNHGGHMA